MKKTHVYKENQSWDAFAEIDASSWKIILFGIRLSKLSVVLDNEKASVLND